MRTTSIITLAAAAAVLMMLSPAPEVQAAETRGSIVGMSRYSLAE